MVGERRPAVDRVGIGGVGALRVEILLVEVVEVRGDEEGQLPLGAQVLEAAVGVLPQVVEELHGALRIVELGGRVGGGVDLLVGGELLHGLQEAVEGVVARRGRRVAHPHRGADVLGHGLAEEGGLGLLEHRAREVVHVDVGAGGDALVDEREVVGGREAQFGLHALQGDRLLVFGRRGAARPPCGVVLLEDVALAVPQLHGGGCGEVVEDPHAQILGRGAREHRAEEDGLQIGAGVLLGVFEVTHVFEVFRVGCVIN